MPKVTLGLSMHRPEMIPIISRQMRKHESIFLKEPPVEGFGDMLSGNLSVDRYLLEQDVEYPEFSRAMQKTPWKHYAEMPSNNDWEMFQSCRAL